MSRTRQKTWYPATRVRGTGLIGAKLQIYSPVCAAGCRKTKITAQVWALFVHTVWVTETAKVKFVRPRFVLQSLLASLYRRRLRVNQEDGTSRGQGASKYGARREELSTERSITLECFHMSSFIQYSGNYEPQILGSGADSDFHFSVPCPAQEFNNSGQV